MAVEKREKKRYRAMIAPEAPFDVLFARYDINKDKEIYTWAYSENQAMRNIIMRYPDREVLGVYEDTR